MKRIIITIPKDGPTKIDLEGYSGVSCQGRADHISKVLAGTSVEKELKPEYFEEDENSEGLYELQ